MNWSTANGLMNLSQLGPLAVFVVVIASIVIGGIIYLRRNRR